MKNFLSVKNLSYRYDLRKPDGILDLNFDLQKGEILALMGPSGAGKTTALKLLKNEIETQTGEIVFHEEVKIGFIRQQSIEDQNQTVFNLIDQSLQEIQDPEKRENQIRSTLSQLEITNEIDSKLSEISGGQLQRVLIAKELAHNPNLIFFDEPFANLDLPLKTDLIEEIIPLLREQEITIIWTTHYFEEVMPYADRILLINSGEIQAFDTPEKLYFEPENIFSALFFGKNNILPAKKTDKGFRVLGVEFPCEQERVELATIRPSDIHFTPSGGIKARIEGSEYRGNQTYWKVNCQGQELWVQANPRSRLNGHVQIEINHAHPLS